MKFLTTLVMISMPLFLLQVGCSSEEPPPPLPKKPKVVMRITKPKPQPPVAVVQEEAQPGSAKAGEKPPVPEKRPEPVVPETVKKDPGPGAMVEVKGSDGKVAIVQTVEQKKTEISVVEEKKVEEIPVKEEPPVVEEEKGIYVVQAGDSLSLISTRADIFGDPLKWPILLRLNLSRLGGVTMDEKISDVDLPEGTKLKVPSSEDARNRAQSMKKNIWVVNALSSPIKEEINSAALTLIKEGYSVYITTTMVKGKEWMRLRIGFYRGRSEASEEGKKIEKIIGLKGSWPAKIGPEEMLAFAGY